MHELRYLSGFQALVFILGKTLGKALGETQTCWYWNAKVAEIGFVCA